MEEHDSSYRQFFSFPQMVKDLLQGYVHESWVSELNFDVMEPMETSFVSEGLSRREADVIWRIQWKTRWLYVYVLIEMQSSIDPMMALRLLTYTSLLYQNLHKQKRLSPDGLLPPVLPVTIYNGSVRWTAARSFSDLIEPVPDSLLRYQPQFSYFLLDESQLKQATKTDNQNVVGALIGIETSEGAEELTEKVNHLAGLFPNEDSELNTLSGAFATWLMVSLLPARFSGVKLPAIRNLLEVNDMLSENVKSWTQEWLEQGLEQGRQKGLEQGSKKAYQQVAMNMLAEGASVESICRVTGLSMEEVRNLAG